MRKPRVKLEELLVLTAHDTDTRLLNACSRRSEPAPAGQSPPKPEWPPPQEEQ